MACFVWSVLLPLFFFSLHCNKANHLSSQLCMVYVSTVITKLTNSGLVHVLCWVVWISSSFCSTGQCCPQRVVLSLAAGLAEGSGSAEEQQDWDLSPFLFYPITKVLLSVIKLMHINLCIRLFFKQSPLNSLETTEQVLVNMTFILITK